jgi:predicted nucleic acid-binding Zn ribbon protein
MPTYDYFCEQNGQTVEVSHRMAEQLHSWGELCRRAGIEPGSTPAAAPVRKLLAAVAVHGSRSSAPAMAACENAADCGAAPVCCGGGGCHAGH